MRENVVHKTIKIVILSSSNDKINTSNTRGTIPMKKLVIEFSNERLITPSGLALVGQMLGKSNFIKKCNNIKVDGKRSQSQIKNGDILLS